MEAQGLGELKTVSNTLRDHAFEADDLVVGWVMVDGDLHRVAFTPRELLRPMDRAKTNLEDMLTLGAKPPTHDDVQELHDENVKLVERLEELRDRGLLDRIFNRGWDDAD